MTESSNEVVSVAGIQCDVQLADKTRNLETMTRWTAAASDHDAQLVVFPECALTGYCFDSRDEAWEQAEPAQGSGQRAVQEMCARHAVHIVYGFLERDGSKLFNSVNLVGPQGWLGTYRKTHLPYLGVDRFTDAGQEPYQVFEAGHLRVGMLICYDCSFPEPNRCLALAGADLIALPTNWPPGAGCTADFVPNTRALENNVYYMAINRVGSERGFEFIGKSKICDTSGADLCVAGESVTEEMLLAEVSPAIARQKRLVRVPGQHEIDRFGDRRPDLYSPIAACRDLLPSGQQP